MVRYARTYLDGEARQGAFLGWLCTAIAAVRTQLDAIPAELQQVTDLQQQDVALVPVRVVARRAYRATDRAVLEGLGVEPRGVERGTVVPEADPVLLHGAAPGSSRGGSPLHHTEEPATARFRITPPQAAAFVECARELMKAGRPICPMCGRPKDPDGHVCPRSNGYGAR